LEAATPGKTLPSKQELLDFQARWMRPAGIAAILGAAIFAVSLPLQPSVSGDTDAERLTEFHQHSTQLVIGQGVLIGIGLLFFIPLLYVLIRSAQGRSERIPRAMVALAFVGPILFSVSGFVVALGLNDAASKFVEQAPAKEQQARQQAEAAPKPTTTTTTRKTTTTSSTSTGQGSTTTQGATTTTTTPAQAVTKARDDLASHVIDDTTILQVGSLVRFLGLLTLVFAMVYIPLWAMRTGLLTRFWGTLGLALGVSIILVPVGIFGLVLWFAAVGLQIAGWWPGPLPPAWAEGKAVPPPPRGGGLGPPVAEREGALEGSGREVSEQPLPENGASAAEPEQGETQGQRRKKRKRRR
jgi:hypothetical protein